MKRMDRRKQGMLRKPAIGMLAAVTAFTGMPLSAGIQAKASGSDELTARIQAIAQTQTKVDAAREKLIAEYSSGKHTVPEKPAAFKALFVKCSDVTMENTEIVDGKETTVKTRYTIGRDSDANTVIDHAIDRFEETVEATTANAVDIIPTTIWVDDPVTVPAAGFGNSELIGKISRPIPVEQYDSVFFFLGKQGVYGVTGRGVKDLYGESCIFIADIPAEMQHINDGLDVDEERKLTWTCGTMTHEWIHQLDISSKEFLNAEHFPMCHDYVIEGNTGEEWLRTEENGDIYLTNPQNGFKWKYIPGRYPDALGDYYDAFLAGEVIDTKDGNKKKGMFPALWHFIRERRDAGLQNGSLGTYTFQNTKTGNYLIAADEKDRFGASKLITVKASEQLPVNTLWDISYDTFPNHAGTVTLSPKNFPTQLIRSEDGASVDTVALYERGWGTGELENKNFSFNIVRTDDGNYQIKSTLKAFADYNLCENADGSVSLKQDDETGTWKLASVGKAQGVYCIRNLGTRGALTLKDEKAAILPYAYDSLTSDQEWFLAEQESGWFTVYASDSTLCLTAADKTAKAGTEVTLKAYAGEGSDPQLWEIRKDADGFCRIISKTDPTLCIAWIADETKQTMQLQKTGDSKAQLWDLGQPQRYAMPDEGYYCIKTADGKYLSGNDKKKDDILLIKSEKPFYWKVSKKADCYFWIEGVNDSLTRFLDVADSVNAEGNSIRLCSDTSLCGDPEGAGYAQQWAFEKNTDGTYTLYPKLTFARGLALKNDGYDTVAYLSGNPESFTFVPVNEKDVTLPEYQPEVSTVKGDANCDYQVDVSDAVLIARFCAEDKNAEITQQGKKNADVNHNSNVDTEDTIVILKYIAHIIRSFD